MARSRALRVVESDPEQPADITALLRADINRRDWAGMHIAADRRPFISLMPARRWRYR